MYKYVLTERGKIVIAVALVLLLFLLPAIILLCTAIINEQAQPPENQGSETRENQGQIFVDSNPPETMESTPPAGGDFDKTDIIEDDRNDGTENAEGAESSEGLENAEGAEGVQGAEEPEGSEGPESKDDTVGTGGTNGTESTNDSTNIDDTASTDGTNKQEPSDTPISGLAGADPIKGTLSFLFNTDGKTPIDDQTLSALDEFVKSPKNTYDSSILIEIPKLPAENAAKLYSALLSAFSERGVPEQRLAYVSRTSVTVEGAFEVRMSFTKEKIK